MRVRSAFTADEAEAMRAAVWRVLAAVGITAELGSPFVAFPSTHAWGVR